MKRLLSLVCIVAAALAFRGVAVSAEPDAAGGVGPVRIVVTIPPLMWPVTQLVGEGTPDAVPAEVTLILRPGLSEHGFELTPVQMQAVRRADVVVMAGHGLEPPQVAALAGRSGWSAKVVSFEGIDETVLLEGDHADCDHDHDGAGGHAHDHDHASSVDPHMWLDPVAMKAFVGRVAEALRAAVEKSGRSDDDKARLIRAINTRAAAAQKTCADIDAEHIRALTPLKDRAIVTHHNAYAYLCKRYGLKVAAVIRPVETVEPTPGDVMKAVKAIKEQKAGAVFVEPQFPAGIAKRIADTAKVRLESIDPLGDGDWAALMRSNMAALVRGLGG
jgi:zinc transport system substrate-binding protein